MANPDARKEAEQQIYQRKNMDDAYGDVNQCGDDEFSQFGIDLNRNFPFHWNITPRPRLRRRSPAPDVPRAVR